MTNFPLAAFLTSLSAEGIALSVRDYDRLLVLFRTGGVWTLPRLKNVIVSLLAKDEDQQRSIERKFEKFFDAKTDAAIPEFDVRQVVEDLRRIGARPMSVPQTTPEEQEEKDEEVEVEAVNAGISLKARKTALPWILAGASLLLLIGFGIWLAKTMTEPHIDAPLLEVRPRSLSFGTQPPDSTEEKPLALKNSGAAPLIIQEMRLIETAPNDFEVHFPQLPLTLQPGEEITLKTVFSPKSEGGTPVSGTLEIRHNAAEQAETVSFEGICAGEHRTRPENRLYSNVPFVKELRYPPRRRLSVQLLLTIIPAGLTLFYFLCLWRLKQGPRDKAPLIDKNAPQMFHPGVIGASPQAWLDAATLDEAADSMGYFQSAEAGRRLNVTASITATVRKGGIPTCNFQHRKRLRTLLILEDANAEALDWNPVSRELAAGMKRRGIPLIHGRFHGTPLSFRNMDDGQIVHLEDLEDQRQGILLLLFTDGKSFFRPQQVFALEAIARWPMLAWMDLREQRFWDDTLNLPCKLHIPVYPAARDGLLEAVRSFLTERGPQSPSRERTEVGFPSTIEHLLGETLPWAQECAMMQPMPEGLADALRWNFHKTTVPPERIECLYALPNTTRTNAGLRFSDEVLKTLRRGFLNCRSEKEQQKVVTFILEQIEKAKPTLGKRSLAYLSWEALRERMRLEADPEYDLQRFGELMQTDLAQSLADSLENYGFPDEQPDRIPLRLKPRNQKALQRLGRIPQTTLKIPSFVRWQHRAILIALTAIFCSVALFAFFRIKPVQNLEILGRARTPFRLEVLDNETWKLFREEETAAVLAETPLPENAHYRLRLYGGGVWTQTEFDVQPGRLTQLTIAEEKRQRPCLDEYPDIGLIVERCPEQRNTQNAAIQIASWQERLGKRAPKGRVMSIGLEFSDHDQSVLQSLRQSLLASSSVDVIYRIQPDENKVWQVEQAVERLRRDLSHWLARTQLLWWKTAAAPGDADVLPECQRALKMSAEAAPGFDNLIALLESGDKIALTEAEIIQAMGNAAKATGVGAPILLAAGPQTEWTDPITGMEFVRIPGGCFQMGSPESEEGRYSDEGPVHEVCLDGFYMGKYEVTNAQYRRWKRNHDSGEFKGYSLNSDSQPVVSVSWEDAQAFVEWLTQQHDGKYTFRLPSEAEWEYAARAGTTTSRFWGDNPDDACRYANVYDQTSKKAFDFDWTAHDCNDGYAVTAPVGAFRPNAFGLYDMLGNVYEWTEDLYVDDIYARRSDEAPVSNPISQSGGSNRVLRGGGWGGDPRGVRCALRGGRTPSDRFGLIGFRVVVSSRAL